MRPLLLLAALLFAVTAEGSRCMDAGDKALFAVKSWEGLGAWITDYPECDDGGLAAWVTNLVGEWLSAGPEQFAALARAAKTTPRLLDVAARHVNSLLGRDTTHRIRAHADYRCPDGAAEVCRRVIESLDDLDRELIQLPKEGPPVRVARRAEAAVSGDATVFARSGFDALVFSPAEPGTGLRESPGTVAAWRGGALERIGQWPMSISGVFPHAPLGERDPYLVLPGAGLGYATEPLRAIRYSELLAGTGVEKAIELPTGLRSPVLLRAGIRLLAAGYTFERKQDGAVAGPAGLGGPRAHNLAIYDLASGKPAMVAIRERLSEHAENNLAAGVAKDGVVHILVTEVLVSRDNASRVLHLRFDPQKRAWLDERVLLHRPEFTSDNRPRLAAAGGALEAFWLPYDGRELTGAAADGLYAYQLDSYAVWRLTETNVKYAVLPDADGRGAMLAGVHAAGTSKVRWFLRRNDQWRTAGETDLGETVYTPSSGTDPFALWRDRAGTVRAAFMGDRKLIVVELTLPE